MVRSRCWERLSPRRLCWAASVRRQPLLRECRPQSGQCQLAQPGSTRVHGNAQCKQHAGAGGPVFGADGFDGAYTYIQALLAYLNANFSNPAGVDPFSAASDVIPQQTGAYMVEYSVTPSTNSHNNYNFAVASVRMRGPQGPAGEAQNTPCFLPPLEHANRRHRFSVVDLSQSQRRRGPASTGRDNRRRSAIHSFPFFTTGNAPESERSKQPRVWHEWNQQQNHPHPRRGPGLGLLWVLPERLRPGQCHQWSAGTDAPEWDASLPRRADRLRWRADRQRQRGDGKPRELGYAQRNLQVTASYNPGPPPAHIIPQTFDLRPSLPPILGQDVLLRYPDELMIDWGNTPVGSKASIYWPQAERIADPANRVRALSHLLSAADANTDSMSSHGRRHLRPGPLRGQPEPRGAAHDRPAANRRDGAGVQYHPAPSGDTPV